LGKFKLSWNLKTVTLLFLKNLTGSGRFNKKYLQAQGYDIDDSARIGGGVVMDTRTPGRIHIGKRVVLGLGSMLVAHGPGLTEDLHLGEDAFIGAGAIVLYSVGARSVVGAGAVVTRPIPPDEVWAGNPARRLK